MSSRSSATPANPIVAFAGRPALAGFLGAMAISASGVLVRVADVPPASAAIFRAAYALPALAILAWLERRAYGPRPARQRQVALFGGVFFAIDLVVWHHSIEYVGAGLSTVLANTQVLIVAFAAWLLLGERPSGRLLASLPLALLGVVLISGVVGAEPYGSNPVLGVVTGVTTGFAYAAFLLVLRGGNADPRRPAGPLFDATLVTAIVALLMGLPLGEVDLVPTWPAHGWLILLALSAQVVGWLLISVSLPRLPAAVTSVLLTAQPVASVLLAVVLLGEAPSPVQLLGAAAILAGLLLATSRRSSRPPVAEPEIG
ncbi:MAG TPA: DMT family transporter [Candidatus Limnocylindria bacterium]|nr:DMT family transporter [Candidatus Limnocylindria bacterium]